MQFGLDAPNKENADAMFHIAANSTPRKRIEAKSYRARDRADHGWFQHNDATSSLTPTKSSAASDSNCCCRCGKGFKVFTHPEAPSPKSVTSKSALRAEGRQNRDKVLGYDHRSEWFSHEHQHTPSKGISAPVNEQGPDTASSKKREIYPRGQDWYRHEHTMLCAEGYKNEDAGGKLNGKSNGFSSPSWWPSTNEDVARTLESPRARVIGQDAERNRQRDQGGSAKDWYHHDHTGATCPVMSVVGKGREDGSRIAPSVERDPVCGCCHAAEVVVECGSKVEPHHAHNRARRALDEKFHQLKQNDLS